MKMNVLVVAFVATLPSAVLAFAFPPPSTGCPPTALCEFVPQLFTIPAFFPINQHSDSSKSSDWIRIQSAGGWIQNVVALGDVGGFQQAPLATDCPPAGAGGELCDAKNQFAANFQANQFVFGYVNTQFGTRPYGPGSALLSELHDWQQRFPSQIQGMFLDNGRPSTLPKAR